MRFGCFVFSSRLPLAHAARICRDEVIHLKREPVSRAATGDWLADRLTAFNQKVKWKLRVDVDIHHRGLSVTGLPERCECNQRP